MLTQVLDEALSNRNYGEQLFGRMGVRLDLQGEIWKYEAIDEHTTSSTASRRALQQQFAVE